MNLHDTCGNFNIHGVPGIQAAILSAIFAVAKTIESYKQEYGPN